MYNLEEIRKGSSCTICWILGELGKQMKKWMNLDLDDEINVLYNDGTSIIIRHNNQTYALDSCSAHAIKVTI